MLFGRLVPTPSVCPCSYFTLPLATMLPFGDKFGWGVCWVHSSSGFGTGAGWVWSWGLGCVAANPVVPWLLGWGTVYLGGGTGHGDGTGVLLGNGRGVFLYGGTGVFLGCGTGVFLGDGTRLFLGDAVGWSLGVCWPDWGFPLGVVNPGPPVDMSKKFSVLAPSHGPGWGCVPSGFG